MVIVKENRVRNESQILLSTSRIDTLCINEVKINN